MSKVLDEGRVPSRLSTQQDEQAFLEHHPIGAPQRALHWLPGSTDWIAMLRGGRVPGLSHCGYC